MAYHSVTEGNHLVTFRIWYSFNAPPLMSYSDAQAKRATIYQSAMLQSWCRDVVSFHYSIAERLSHQQKIVFLLQQPEGFVYRSSSEVMIWFNITVCGMDLGEPYPYKPLWEESEINHYMHTCA